MTLAELIKDGAYKLSKFKPAQIGALEASITLRDRAKTPTPYVECLVRGKPIKLTPEEAVRQLYVMVLRDDFGYPVSRMELGYGVTLGREKKRADICIFDKDKTTTLKAKSERLLEAAKHPVEIAIEQDEVAGQAYLEREGAMP